MLPLCLIFELAGRPVASTGGDPERLGRIIAILREADFQENRDTLLEALARLADPCGALEGMATERLARVRENAVRGLAAAGCADFASYRPFADDQSPWVQDALAGAARHYRMREAVPHLIDRLEDRRRILDAESVRTIGEASHEALIAMTCHSFLFDTDSGPAEREAAVSAWRAWWERHRDDPGDTWIRDGIEAARGDLAGDDSRRRVEAVRVLAHCGEPAAATLRGALARNPGDLASNVTCAPEEPPRIREKIPCTMETTNASGRRLLIAPSEDPLAVRLTRLVPEAGRGAGGAAAKDSGSPPSPAAGRGRSSFIQDLLAAVVDLEPGEKVRRDFEAGPVLTAGRYEVRATLKDLAESVLPLPAIEGTAVIRFEQ